MLRPANSGSASATEVNSSPVASGTPGAARSVGIQARSSTASGSSR